MKFIKDKVVLNPDMKVDLFSIMFSSGLFVGYVPKASGTFGSLFALIFFLIPGLLESIVLLPIIFTCFIIGVFVSGNMIKRYGDDPSVVIIDEIVGMWITVFIVSGLFSTVNVNSTLLGLFVAFVTFRFFDIIKIQPAKYFDKLKNGFGIMMDDVIAGIYAGILSCIILSFVKQFIN